MHFMDVSWGYNEDIMDIYVYIYIMGCNRMLPIIWGILQDARQIGKFDGAYESSKKRVY